jgi:hypothetical protein
MPEFKPGDKVRCINAYGCHGITEGKVYEVRKMNGSGVGVELVTDDNGNKNTPYAHRFELVKEAAREFRIKLATGVIPNDFDFGQVGFTNGFPSKEHAIDIARRYFGDGTSFEVVEVVSAGSFTVRKTVEAAA